MPLLPGHIMAVVRWAVEYLLYLGVGTPDEVSESCILSWDPWCKRLPLTVLQHRAWA